MAMNPLAELDQLNLEPAAKTQVAALIRSLLEQSDRDAKIIQTKDIKIAALTHELAYYKRMRFSSKSEALAPLQREVFEETWNTDISAIEAEVEQLRDDQPCDTIARSKRPRAGRKMLLHFLHSPHPCGLTATLTRSSAAYRTSPRTRILHLWTVWPGFGQNR
jgi:transposase